MKVFSSAIIIMLSLSVLPSQLWAENTAPIRSATDIPGAVKIDAEQLIELVNNVNDVVIIDSRLTKNRSFGFIEDSISLPDTKTNCTSLKQLVSNFSSSVVFYCNGPKCGRSDNAVKTALNCGYNKVFWYRGGIEEWQHKNYPLVIN